MHSLNEGAVDLWIVELTPALTPRIAALEPMLSSAERRRADAFHFPHHRRDYIVSHALLRTAIACYLCCDPATLTFGASDFGRPVLVEGPAWLDFNLTHTDGLAAVAVGCADAVGVDAEALAPVADQLELADRWF